MAEYQETSAIFLHDQRVIISKNPITFGTDGSWTLADTPEYVLNDQASELLKSLLNRLGLPTKGMNDLGINRAYAEHKPDGLEKVEALETEDGKLKIRIYVNGPSEEYRWLEEWSYSGAYTVIWLIQPYLEK